MDGISRGKGRLGVMLALALLLLFPLPAMVLGMEARPPSGEAQPSHGPFTLTIQDHLLSLRAQDASLHAILMAIGREMAIDMIVHIPPEERITIAFDRLSLAEAIKKLSPNSILVKDARQGQGKVLKVIILSQGKTGLRPPSVPPGAGMPGAPRPAPFQFEFDPATVMQPGPQ